MSINMFDLNIKKISDFNEVLKAIYAISDSHTPPLIEKIKNVEEYANKLSQNAEVYVYETKAINALIAFYNNDMENKTSYITQITVNKNFQGEGLGKRLLELCFQKSIQEGMEKVRLEVYKKNIKAIRLYQKNGFFIKQDAKKNTFYMIKDLKEVLQND